MKSLGDFCFFLKNQASLEFVQDLLLQPDTRKTLGPGRVHPTVLKEVDNVTATPLSIIGLGSLKRSQSPGSWQFSRRVRRKTLETQACLSAW